MQKINSFQINKIGFGANSNCKLNDAQNLNVPSPSKTSESGQAILANQNKACLNLRSNTISFKGASVNSYDTNFDAYCSRLPEYKSVFSSPKDFSKKAQTQYDKLVKDIFPDNGELSPKYRCTVQRPKAGESGKKITDSRAEILREWIDFLENPIFENKQGEYSGENKSEVENVLDEIKNNHSVKLMILSSMLSKLKNDNEYMPPPINPYALAKTVKTLKSIDRNSVGNFSFSNSYRSNLMYLILNRAYETEKSECSSEDKKGMIEIFQYTSPKITGIWVKVPSKGHNRADFGINTGAVEILSHENWCTKSKQYKAQASLEEGDFYVFLEKTKNGDYKPTIGMALCDKTIFQIQNPSNNDTVAYKYLPVVDYISDKRDLDFDYSRRDDGIPAGRQYEIAKRLKENINGKTLEEAIAQNDVERIFDYAGIEYKKDEKGMLILSKYRPKICIKNWKVPPILFYELGIDENALLSRVSEIEGPCDFENSPIDNIPENVVKLGSRATSRKNQFSEECKSRFKTTKWFETNKTRIK